MLNNRNKISRRIPWSLTLKLILRAMPQKVQKKFSDVEKGSLKSILRTISQKSAKDFISDCLM